MSNQYPKMGLHSDFTKCEDAREKINENFRKLDALSNTITVLDFAPQLPFSGSTGDAYVLESTNEVWVYEDRWVNYGVKLGWNLFNLQDSTIYYYYAGQWRPYTFDINSRPLDRVAIKTTNQTYGSTPTALISEFTTELIGNRLYKIEPSFRYQVAADTGVLSVTFNYEGSQVGQWVSRESGAITGSVSRNQPNSLILSTTTTSNLTAEVGRNDPSDLLLDQSSIVITELVNSRVVNYF